MEKVQKSPKQDYQQQKIKKKHQKQQKNQEKIKDQVELKKYELPQEIQQILKNLKTNIISLENAQKPELFQKIIKNMLDYKKNGNIPHYKKYNFEFIFSVISRNLENLEEIFFSHKKKKIELIPFVYYMLQFFQDLTVNESIYITVGLIDFFKQVTENQINFKPISFSDISTFICLNNPFIDDPHTGNQKIPRKQLPIPNYFINKGERREIDGHAPIIIKDSNIDIRRLDKNKIKMDSVHHKNNQIIQTYSDATNSEIIALDAYCDQFLIYNNNCQVKQVLKPQHQKLRYQICQDFCYSEKQQRIGAIFKDLNLGFWDKADNYTFEKVFNDPSLIHEQDRIWYISYIDAWVTSDQKQLHIWDLEQEKVSNSIKSQLFTKGIMEIKEVSYLRVVAIASHKNTISIWDLVQCKLLFNFNADHLNIHTMTYFETFQCILTCGFDQVINIYSLHSDYNDNNQIGRLLGHQSLVTTVKGINNTPIVISSDDRHIVKLWDIRTQTIFQSIDLDLKNHIKFIHSLDDRICFVSNRLISLEFDSPKKVVDQQKIQPIQVEYDEQKQELLIGTRSNSKIIDLYTGKTKKILGGLTEDHEEDITVFNFFHQNKKLFFGNQKGILKSVQISDCELLSEIQAHTDQITQMQIDYQNGLITTSSQDSSINITRYTEKGFETVRQIQNTHYKKPIKILEISVYHNIIITASENSDVLIFSYEFGKLISKLTIQDDEDIQSMAFINGYSIFTISTASSYVYFVKFKLTNNDTINLSLVGVISLFEGSVMHDNNKEYLLKIHQQKLNQRKSKKTVYEQNQDNGNSPLKPNYKKKSQADIKKDSILNSTQKILITKSRALNHKPSLRNFQVIKNYSQFKNQAPPKNSILIVKNDVDGSFLNSMEKMDSDEDNEGSQDNDLDNSINQNLKKNSQKLKVDLKQLEVQYNQIMEKIIANKIIVSMEYNQNDNQQEQQNINSTNNLNLNQQKQTNNLKNVQPSQMFLITGHINGEIRSYDILPLLQDNTIELVNPIKLNMNYNPFRCTKEDVDFSLRNNKISTFNLNNFRIFQNNMTLKETNLYKPIKNVAEKEVNVLMKFDAINSSNNHHSLLRGDSNYQTISSISQYPLHQIQAHKDQINVLKLLPINGKCLVSCSQDFTVKLWNYPNISEKPIFFLNVKHPLPIIWDLKIEEERILHLKILFALKAMQQVQETYHDIMPLEVEQKLHIGTFLEDLFFQDKYKNNNNENKKDFVNQENAFKKSQSQYVKDLNQEQQNLQNIEIDDTQDNFEQNEYLKKKTPKIQLMKDDYDTKDLQYEKVKNLFQKELRGPTLKALEETKKIQDNQNLAKKQTSSSSNLFSNLQTNTMLQNQKFEEEQQDYKHNLKFLNPKFKRNFFGNPEEQYESKYTIRFGRQLDEIEKQQDQIYQQKLKMQRISQIELKNNSNNGTPKNSKILKNKIQFLPQNTQNQNNLKKNTSKYNKQIQNLDSSNAYQQNTDLPQIDLNKSNFRQNNKKSTSIPSFKSYKNSTKLNYAFDHHHEREKEFNKSQVRQNIQNEEDLNFAFSNSVASLQLNPSQSILITQQPQQNLNTQNSQNSYINTTQNNFKTKNSQFTTKGGGRGTQHNWQTASTGISILTQKTGYQSAERLATQYYTKKDLKSKNCFLDYANGKQYIEHRSSKTIDNYGKVLTQPSQAENNFDINKQMTNYDKNFGVVNNDKNVKHNTFRNSQQKFFNNIISNLDKKLQQSKGINAQNLTQSQNFSLNSTQKYQKYINVHNDEQKSVEISNKHKRNKGRFNTEMSTQYLSSIDYNTSQNNINKSQHSMANTTNKKQSQIQQIFSDQNNSHNQNSLYNKIKSSVNRYNRNHKLLEENQDYEADDENIDVQDTQEEIPDIDQSYLDFQKSLKNQK